MSFVMGRKSVEDFAEGHKGVAFADRNSWAFYFQLMELTAGLKEEKRTHWLVLFCFPPSSKPKHCPALCKAL